MIEKDWNGFCELMNGVAEEEGRPVIEKDWNGFCELMNGVAETYGRKAYAPTALRLFFEALADLPLEAVTLGIGRVLRTSRFAPTAAEIREAIIGTVDDRAVAAYAQVVEALRRVTDGESVRFSDPAIHWALRHGCRGWTGFAKMDAADAERIFTRYYAAAVRLGKTWRSEDVPDHLPGRRELKGSVFRPWRTDQIVRIDGVRRPELPEARE